MRRAFDRLPEAAGAAVAPGMEDAQGAIRSPRAAGTALRFDATIPRRDVHKHALEEVLITDCAALSDEVFACAAHLPRSHRTYVPAGARRHDLLLLNEVARQATIVCAHRHLDVPAGRQLLGRAGSLAITDPAACRWGPAPGRATLAVAADERREIDGALVECTLQVEVDIDGTPAARGRVRLLILTRDDYRALRGAPADTTARTSPKTERAAPAHVGRREASEVVVAAIEHPRADAARAALIVDVLHPSFFDHPVDHVPAMLLTEAARQTAHAALGGANAAVTPVALDVRAIAFAELSAPLTCDATARENDGSHRRVTTWIRQHGVVVMEIDFSFAACDDGE